VLIEAFPVLHLADLAAPGTPEAERLAAETPEGGMGVVVVDAPGFVVVSQTCDIVRSCADRPYVEVCPLTELPDEAMPLVRRGRRGQFVALPTLSDAALAADLDRVTTMEKSALVQFQDQRCPGVSTEAEVRDLAEALARKRGRAAFPDDFVALIAPLQRRIVERHGRDSDEGRFLRAVREIRVRAVPDWAAETVELELLFIFDALATVPADADVSTQALAKRVVLRGRYADISARSVGLDQISAATYLEADRLDLDHLSPRVG